MENGLNYGKKFRPSAPHTFTQNHAGANRAINTGGITSIANTFRLSKNGNSATGAIKVDVKDQGQESNFLF